MPCCYELDIYARFFITPFIQELVKQNQLYLLIYDIEQEVIERWHPRCLRSDRGPGTMDLR